jgi:hypothetical protein
MIYIITTCTRPENLETIKETIPPECVWVVVFDKSIEDSQPADGAINLYSPFTGHWGMPNRNFALDELEFADEDWIYVLDDDNIIHPEWYQFVKDLNDPHLNMINWGQVHKDGSIRLNAVHKPALSQIDTACYMVRGHLMRYLRYTNEYAADGLLAEKAYTIENTLRLENHISYYNYLRRDEHAIT